MDDGREWKGRKKEWDFQSWIGGLPNNAFAILDLIRECRKCSFINALSNKTTKHGNFNFKLFFLYHTQTTKWYMASKSDKGLQIWSIYTTFRSRYTASDKQVQAVIVMCLNHNMYDWEG